jgi:hypothetical protein
VEGVACRIVKAAVGLVEMVSFRIGSASSQDLANYTGSGKVEVAEAETWWKPGECSWRQRMIQGPSEATERVGEGEQEAGASPLVVAAGK